MESSRFDHVTRMFGASRSRRSLGAGGIAALVALLAGGNAETAFAKKKKRSRKKEEGSGHDFSTGAGFAMRSELRR
jgi:hypothetical protein